MYDSGVILLGEITCFVPDIVIIIVVHRSEYPKTYKTSSYHKISSMSNSHTQSYLPLNVSVLPGITITDR